MTKYESPSIRFENLTLFERIAEICWGSKTVTFDYPYDDEHNDPITPDPIPTPLSLGSGCGNQSNSVLTWLQGNLTPAEYSYWESLNLNSSSNLANTQVKGFTVKPS